MFFHCLGFVAFNKHSCKGIQSVLEDCLRFNHLACRHEEVECWVRLRVNALTLMSLILVLTRKRVRLVYNWFDFRLLLNVCECLLEENSLGPGFSFLIQDVLVLRFIIVFEFELFLIRFKQIIIFLRFYAFLTKSKLFTFKQLILFGQI